MKILEKVYDEIIQEKQIKTDLLNEDINRLNEIKDWFGCCDAYATMDNPLSLLWGNEIDESLTKTYPVTSAKEHICKFFNLPERYFNIYQNKYNTYCFITFPEKNNSLGDMIKAMEWYGYFCSVKNPKPNEYGWYTLKFESKFEENANELLRNETHLIHLTQAKFKDKILKQGFVPKSKNKKFNYPDRTYFMLGSQNPIETLQLAKNLKQVENGKNTESEYCAFRIDVSKIPSNVIFHKDPNYGGAVYTRDNLTPNCIRDYMLFKI